MVPVLPSLSPWLQSSASSSVASRRWAESPGLRGLELSASSLPVSNTNGMRETALLTDRIIVLTLTVAVGVGGRPAAAPQTGPWESDFKLFGSPTFVEAISAVSSLVFSFAGTPGFFPIAAEMKDPRLYTRALIICQSIVTSIYIAIGVVVYFFAGSYVASPALGSAGPLLKRVCYGLALPGLCVSTILLSHVSRKHPPQLSITDYPTVACQVCFPSYPSRHQARLTKHIHTLRDMVQLYGRHHYHLLHHRERHPSIRWLGVAHWCSPGNTPLFPALWLHVALRSLAWSA